MESRIAEMHVLDLNTISPFKDLFPIREVVLKEIVSDMKTNGYDPAHPIILWGGHRATVIDGHTRLCAAKEAGIIDIPVVTKDFSNEREALEYAISAQRNRRNLTSEELLNCLAELDKRKGVGRPEKTAKSVAISGRSSQNTAEVLGISRGKVEKMRTINDHASPEIRNAITSGNMSIDKGYKETMKKCYHEKSAEPLTEEMLLKLKSSRLQSLRISITKMMAIRLERETQEYPDCCYSDSERDELARYLSLEISKQINTMLQGEHNNE